MVPARHGQDTSAGVRGRTATKPECPSCLKSGNGVRQRSLEARNDKDGKELREVSVSLAKGGRDVRRGAHPLLERSQEPFPVRNPDVQRCGFVRLCF